MTDLEGEHHNETRSKTERTLAAEEIPQLLTDVAVLIHNANQ